MKKFNLIFGISALFLVFILGCSPREDVDNPEACFNYTPTTALFNGDIVSFDATCSQNALSYEWDFNDGESGSGSVTTHRFEEPGEYDVTLVVQNKYLTDQKTATITIEENNIIASVENNRYETIYLKEIWDYYDGTNDTIIEYKTKTELQENGAYSIIEFKSGGILYVDGYNEGTWTQNLSEVSFVFTGEDYDMIFTGTITGDIIKFTYFEADDDYSFSLEIHFSKL